MHEYVLTLLAAAAVTYLLTPLVRRFAVAVGAQRAARDRDVHVAPTPLLGGFAMYGGLAAGLLVASRLSGLSNAFVGTNMSKGLLLAGGLIVIMGFVDDRWGMGAISKLAGQVAAGVILVWSGAVVNWLPEPNGGTFGLDSNQQTVITILVVVVTINAVNFIDGLDGLAAGVVGIGAAAFFTYYYTLTHRLTLSDQTGPALTSAVLTGICLGFLPHNFHRAKIFMGDTGSMLIGLLLAYAPISSLASLDPGSLTSHGAYASGTVNRFGAIVPLLLPAAILVIPYTDLLLAVIRRTRAGLSPFAADRKHLHHRLLDIGHPHRRSVLILYLWAALFSGSVVWLSIVRTPLLELVAVTFGGMLALLLLSVPRLRWWARRRRGEVAAAAARAGRRPAPARAQRAGAGRTPEESAAPQRARPVPGGSPPWLAESAPPGVVAPPGNGGPVTAGTPTAEPAGPPPAMPRPDGAPPPLPATGLHRESMGGMPPGPAGPPPVPPAWGTRGPGR